MDTGLTQVNDNDKQVIYYLNYDENLSSAWHNTILI